MLDRSPLASVALGTNNSSLSAIGTDYGYDQVFARELNAVGRSGDVFIPLSTSGNSPNILTATEVAKNLGILTIGMIGQTGGRLKEYSDCLCIPSDNTARIQECHIICWMV